MSRPIRIYSTCVTGVPSSEPCERVRRARTFAPDRVRQAPAGSAAGAGSNSRAYSLVMVQTTPDFGVV